MGILFQQMTGVTEVYSSAPASLQTSIKASFNSNVIGTGILITFESPDPHLIQFVDRGIFEIKDNKRVDSPNYSMIRYGLSGDTGKNTKKFSQKGSRIRYVDTTSTATSPRANEEPRIPCVITGEKLEFFDAPGNTFAVAGGSAEPGEVGEFVAVTFCLSGSETVKIVKWTLKWESGKKGYSTDVRFKEPNQDDVTKYRGYLQADGRWTGKGTQYMADVTTASAQSVRVAPTK